MIVRRHCILLLLGALLLGATTACEEAIVKDDSKQLPSAASMRDDVEVWDLRERPSPKAVGIGDDETSVYGTRPSRPLRLRLAGGAGVELPIRYIAFSTILSRDDQVVSIDLKTARMPLEEVVERFDSVLRRLDLPAEAVAEFERRAERATGTERVISDRVDGRYGTLDVGVLARYSPHVESGSVALGGSWLKNP